MTESFFVRAIQIAKATIGLNIHGPRRRNGEAYYNPCQNHYTASSPREYSVLDWMRNRGYMEKENCSYRLTQKGFLWLSSILSIDIWYYEEPEVGFYD